MCCIYLWCRLCTQKFDKLNFLKTGLKSKFGVNPYFFPHELYLYITRFGSDFRGDRIRCDTGQVFVFVFLSVGRFLKNNPLSTKTVYTCTWKVRKLWRSSKRGRSRRRRAIDNIIYGRAVLRLSRSRVSEQSKFLGC